MELREAWHCNDVFTATIRNCDDLELQQPGTATKWNCHNHGTASLETPNTGPAKHVTAPSGAAGVSPC
jgi:hypothetical protein